ncbi:ATP-binding protein [Dactylosporangium roseum]|uniref:ATP-binding protein n=1 Tax=Dactylosporangium roseum TaxID=47989 RepID=A0ABY5ZC53_9ACTN|nr:ATP-binding protein [Dactylosporangium roseum]UWZ39151.1 ATP-binding protein [Dactylosporangium roseum]
MTLDLTAPPTAPTTDAGLDCALAAWRLATGTYLRRLRGAWRTAHTEDADVTRLIAGIDPPGPPDPEDAEAFRGLARAAGTTGRLGLVAAALGLDDAAVLTVAAAWWADADPQFGVALGCCHDDGSRRYPTAALVRLLLAGLDVAAPAELAAADPLVHGGAVLPAPGPHAPLRLTTAARRYLSGAGPAGCPDVPGGAPHTLDPVLLAGLGRAVSGGGAVLVRGSGARAVALAGVRHAGRTPVEDATAGEYRFLSRLCAAVPVIDAEEAATLGWHPADGPLAAYGPAGGPGAAALPAMHVVDLPAVPVERRAAAWRAAFERYGLPAEVAAELAARFAFDEDEIADTMHRAFTRARVEGHPPGPDDVWHAARHRPGRELTRVATAVRPVFALDDLVVPAETRRQLDELVSHVRLAHQVLERWGFTAVLPRGRGVVALLYGPSGTGKTMAAEAVAHALGQDLYRVDLSAVVSKYIGETEKNLALAFDEAERAGAVLLFDECDALFGKRTEQRDAHDRWANLEVNYLLQRVETFAGLAVLATNKRTALDEAFLRRLRFAIRFDPPDAALRERLWRRAFPPGVPRAGVDPAALADAELAGGHIVQVALSAAFLAAASGDPVGPAHLTRAMRREYEKLGKSWVGGDGHG